MLNNKTNKAHIIKLEANLHFRKLCERKLIGMYYTVSAFILQGTFQTRFHTLIFSGLLLCTENVANDKLHIRN
jgi:hypothetical protein